MNPTVIDTLRYADRLKAAGVEPGQAEAMSRALNAELTEGLVTKSDLDAATVAVKSDLDAATVALKAELGTMGGKFAAEFAEMDGKFAAIDAKFDAMDAKFDGMDAKFDAMDAKFDSLSSQFANQGRYVFLALALIASLGLYNAVAPLGKASQQTGSTQPVAAPLERDHVAPTADSRG